METPDHDYSRRSLIWPKTSILDAILIVVLGEYILCRSLGAPELFLSEPAVIVFNAAWAASPFALIGSFHKALQRRGNLLLSSAAGLAVTFAGWAWFYHRIYEAGQSGGFASVLAPGLLILLLPALVFAVMMFIALVTRLRGN